MERDRTLIRRHATSPLSPAAPPGAAGPTSTTPPAEPVGGWLRWARGDGLLLAVLAATFALCVFEVPWQLVDAAGHPVRFAGYAPLYRPPEVPPRAPATQGYALSPPLPNYRVDPLRFALELAGCALVGGAVQRWARK